MGGSEDTDGDFLHRITSLRLQSTDPLLKALTPRLATRIFVNGPLCPAAFLLIVWIECTGVPGTLGVPAKMDASLGGCSDCSEDMMVEKEGSEGLSLKGS